MKQSNTSPHFDPRFCKYCEAKFTPQHCNDWYCCIECRFWDKADKPSPDECWNWISSLNNKGYGQFHVNSGLVLAHRFSYELHHGPIPDGMYVLHHCDNPACINFRHLWLGDDTDNVHDMFDKGRDKLLGEKNVTAKLTADEVREIRQRYSKGDISQRQLADEYNVSNSNICYIVTRRSWTHVT